MLIAVDHRIVRVVALVPADGFRAARELGGLNRWVYFEVARIALGGAAVFAPIVAFACAGSLRRAVLAGAFLFSPPMLVAFLAVIMHVETTTAWLFVLAMSAALTLASLRGARAARLSWLWAALPALSAPYVFGVFFLWGHSANGMLPYTYQPSCPESGVSQLPAELFTYSPGRASYSYSATANGPGAFAAISSGLWRLYVSSDRTRIRSAVELCRKQLLTKALVGCQLRGRTVLSGDATLLEIPLADPARDGTALSDGRDANCVEGLRVTPIPPDQSSAQNSSFGHWAVACDEVHDRIATFAEFGSEIKIRDANLAWSRIAWSEGDVRSMFFVDDDHLLVTTFNRLIVLRISDGAVVSSILSAIFQDEPSYDPGSRRAIVGDIAGAVRAFHLDTDLSIRRLWSLPTAPQRYVRFSQDGTRFLAIAASGERAEMRDSDTGALICTRVAPPMLREGESAGGGAFVITNACGAMLFSCPPSGLE